MVLDVLTYGNETLHEKSLPVERVDASIKKLVKDMFDTMYAYNGIGLAAIQVGIPKRIFITDVPGRGGKNVMINPVIKDLSKSTSLYEEGCLSVPGIANDVERPDQVTIEYTDLKGKRRELKANGLLSKCIQHEYDHLDGILFVDRIAPEDRIAKLRDYRKLHTL